MRLKAQLDVARDRLAKVSGRMPKVRFCYEARYDRFWLARFLEDRGIDCLVMDPASLQVLDASDAAPAIASEENSLDQCVCPEWRAEQLKSATSSACGPRLTLTGTALAKPLSAACRRVGRISGLAQLNTIEHVHPRRSSGQPR